MNQNDNCNNCGSKSIIDINRSGNKNSCCSDARNGENRQMNSKSIKAIDCFLNEASKIDKKSNGKSEKAACKSRICVSCEHCSNKSKYRSLKARLHVSIKSKKVADKCEGSPIYDSNECDSSNVKIRHNGSNPIYKEVLRSSILQFFLNQMKNIVLTRELQFDPLKMISERLIEDKKNAELLMLMDLIIKIQVSKVKEIIFQDLLNEEIIPVTFARVFLKQYKFLKTLSHTYSDILKDYETSFLFLHDLSFDLINRAHFKIHLYDDCKDIQNLIDVGHFNVEAGQIFDAQTPDKDKERIKSMFLEMKSDFETFSKWKDVQKKIEIILKNSFEVGKSLLKHIHSYISILDNRKPDYKKDFDIYRTSDESKTNSFKEITTNNSNTQTHNFSKKPIINTKFIECGFKSHESENCDFDTSTSIVYQCSRNLPNSSLGMTMNCQSIYKSLASVKAPSLSRSSSSTNSKGYNSCASTSSFEDSSDGEDGDREDAKIMYNIKRERNACDSISSNLHDNSVNEETKPPTPVSFNGDEDCELKFDDTGEEIQKSDKDPSWDNSELNQDDIEKFNKLYEKYLAENEHLLLENSVNSPSQMSVPDCLKSLKSAEDLHCLLSSLMDKCRKGLDIHDKRLCNSIAHFPETESEHICYSPANCGSHFNNSISNFTEDDFALDPSLIGMKDEDFEIDFEELSRTLSPNSTIQDNLRELEKNLSRPSDSRFGSDKGHPRFRTLVKTCRIYCNKLYEKGSKDHLKRTDSVESLSDSCRNKSSDTKPTTKISEQLSDDESCGGQHDCTSTMNIDIDSNQENCSNNNTSVSNNLSCSETGSSGSMGTENIGNSKVCNCCKCEMFGEQGIFNSNRNVTNVREKYRKKWQKRKQSQMKSESTKSSSISHNNYKATLEDVDRLVKFINGDDANENIPQNPDGTGSVSKKSKSKSNKSENPPLKMKSKSSTPCEDIKNPVIQNSKSSKKLSKDPTVSVNGFNILCNKDIKNDNELKAESTKHKKSILKDKPINEECNSNNTEKVNLESYDDINIRHIDEEKDVYDPVVEDFKRFCENVVPKRRKKLPIDPTLLISEVEKCQQENKSS